MSQAGFKSTGAASSTTYVEDVGTAADIGGILNINSVNAGLSGITTTGSGNQITISLTNRVNATTTTIGAVTSDIITIPLGAVGTTYTFDISVSGYDTVNNVGVGYTLVGSVRTNGAAAVLINQILDEFEDVVLQNANVQILASVNNAVIRVTGVAAHTINWSAIAYYTYV